MSDHTTTVNWGKNLRDMRESKNMSRRALSIRSAVSEDTIKNIETGLVAAPNAETLRLLAEGIGCPIGRLYGEPAPVAITQDDILHMLIPATEAYLAALRKAVA